MFRDQPYEGLRSRAPSKADGNDDAGFAVTPPSISLPKGGGAIRGIGERFAANPVTGTASLAIPIATSPGRSGFGPQLALNYDSGAGNGPFGLGWSLSVPAITRKTDKGLPQYQDGEESDVFLLSGAEDLVPVLSEDDGDWIRHERLRTVDGVDYRINRYRPRIEGLFARIERWTSLETGEIHWRSMTRDNVTTIYGKDPDSRIFDPADPDREHPTRVFSWLICLSFDDRGNAVVYEYAAEDEANVDTTLASEHNRVRTARRYLKRIRYGNRTPNRDVDWRPILPALLPDVDWMFEVVFDYDDGHYREIGLDPARSEADQHRFVRASASVPAGSSWATRPDPFSSYRAGFEVRTYRRCRRVLMFHRFTELGPEPCLVRSTEFDYADLDYEVGPAVDAELNHLGSTRLASFIRSVTPSGYVRQSDGTYLKKSLPPLEFAYSKATIQDDVRELEDPHSLENLPTGLDGRSYHWVDLDGEGVSGVLTEQADAWFYKPNLGEGRFGPQRRVARRPSLAALSGGRQQLLDLAGDGQLDLAEFSGPTPGFYERTHAEDWEAFRPFSSLPDIAWDSPQLRFVDLTGDGHADVLITEDDVFSWHTSLAEAGFGPARRSYPPFDEEHGPRLVFDTGAETIYLADMCGDGLADLVRIRNGEVSYWPNLGYGRFGARVVMEDAPWFDNPEQLGRARIRMADIDGSGTTDIIYLGRDGVRLYFNQSGNRWSGPRRLHQFPRIDDLASVTMADLLGNGTACLVWSSSLPGDTRRPLRYIDLMGGAKPHLLIETVNSLGAETRVHYAPSTHFYLKDKSAGTPWISRLPFPVHVVERVETYERISRNRFVTRYAYHHGYFDGVEREFRGFGMVEQFDTGDFAALSASEDFPTGDNIDAASHVPPVHTKTWFHTGVHRGAGHVSDFFAGLLDEDDRGEYFREPGLSDAEARALLLEDTVLPGGLTLEEEREACRALKGRMLRQEVYALDGTDRAKHPYTVSEQNFTMRVVQPRAQNRHGVFFTHARENLTYHYERDPSDPRAAHAMTLEVDEYGSGLKEVAIGYGRRQPDPALSPEDRAEQTRTLITYTEHRVTNAIEEEDDYRTPLPCESRTYALTGYTPTGAAGRFRSTDFVEPDPDDPDRLVHVFGGEVAYEEEPVAGTTRRLIERVRTLYRADDLTDLLALGSLESSALPGESYRLSFTPGLLSQIYRRPQGLARPTAAPPPEDLIPDPAAVLGGAGADRGGYVDLDGDGHWWIPSGRIFLSPGSGHTAAEELAHARRHFFLPHRARDAFHTDDVPTETLITYDDHDLLMLETRDARGNRVTVGERDPDGDLVRSGNDYRVLQPRLVTDPNRNRSMVVFDAMGMVVGTAVQGKPDENVGDSLEGFEADLTETAMLEHLADPLDDPHAILRRATTRLVYDLFAYHRTRADVEPRPAVAYTLARESHDADLAPGQRTRVQHSFSYSDGFGREIQAKIQAEPGPAPRRDEDGDIVTTPDGLPEITADDVDPRWVGSGWTVFDNKGQPIRRFEPFFTDTHRFEFDVRIGVSPIVFYDPIGRLVATLHPDHTWDKVVFDPWRQESWDANDTMLVADPAADLDAGDFFRRLPDDDYLPTWHAARDGGALGAEEQTAARRAAVHAGTPTVAHLDSLGRTFLTIAHNRFERSDAPPAEPPTEELYETHVRYDVEGNQREVRDAEGRLVMRYDYDMLGTRIRQASMEAGERWLLNDAAGQTLRAWDSRGHQVRTVYDPLRRPVESRMAEGTGPERLVVRTVYGETQPEPEAGNFRGQPVQLFDQAGVVASDAYDFKGNLLRSRRQLAREYKTPLDWSVTVPLEADAFQSTTTYDALDRPTELIAPDDSRVRPTYNEANLLERIEADLRGAETATPFAADIDYDARGQRTRIGFGNGVRTEYRYDPLTRRLVHLRTTRAEDALQDLRYTYDPVGNITRIHDDAQQTLFFRNRRVEPSADYVYDAVYRLIEATGREHQGQTGGVPDPPTPPDAFNNFHSQLSHPGDGQAMGRYVKRYVYDAVGNILSMRHRGSDPAHPGWARDYIYNEASQLEGGHVSNRLSRTSVGGITEAYGYEGSPGLHGSITSMPHLPMMQWDDRDQLKATARQVVADGEFPETTYYVYDAAGQRVRKVTERQALAGQTPTRRTERVYLGGFETYREYASDGDTLTLERETLHVTDDEQRIALVETKTFESGPFPRLRSLFGSPTPLVRYRIGNSCGSACLELDDGARLISYEEYYPYGSTSYQAIGNQVAPRRYRYRGRERDDETGLYYQVARYYAPWLGRWTRCDPAGMADGPNLFRYARNNPIRFEDPTGRSPNDISGPNFRYPWELRPEDRCQGPCLTDREVYREVNEVQQRERRRRKRQREAARRYRKVEKRGSFERRLMNAFIAREGTDEEVWEQALAEGYFHEHEKEKVFRILESKREERFQNIKTRAQIDAINRWENEGRRVKNQIFLQTIQPFIPLAVGGRAAQVYGAYDAAETAYSAASCAGGNAAGCVATAIGAVGTAGPRVFNTPNTAASRGLTQGDLDQLSSRFIEALPETKRHWTQRFNTIAIGLVEDEAGLQHLVYTVSGNRTSPAIRQAAEELGFERWTARSRPGVRGPQGAPADAEQLLIESVNYNPEFTLLGVSATRRFCKDCAVAVPEAVR